MGNSTLDSLTEAQNELYGWIKNYIKEFQHSPSIRQMMQAMGLKSPAPIQSRLKHLQEKGFISWQEGKARTLQLVEDIIEQSVPIMGSVAAGGLIESFSDVQESLDFSEVFKYFINKENKIYLEAANPNYEPIILDKNQVEIQGKLLAVWRKA